MKKVKVKRFMCENPIENDAGIYDETTQYLLLEYDEMLDEIIKHIPYNKQDYFYLLDVGCGTGNLIRRIAAYFPNASIWGLDMSEDMLAISCQKVGKDSRVKLVKMDIMALNESELPYFDIITTSYVFHNLGNKEKYKEAVRLVNEHLAFDGIFLMADLIDQEDKRLHLRYIEKLRLQMQLHQLSKEEENIWVDILEEEDHPMPSQDMESILKEADFAEIEIIEYPERAAALVSARNRNLITLKLELLLNGVRKDLAAEQIYQIQNPGSIWKTGNNGIFVSLDGKHDVLVGINHEANMESPYEFQQSGEMFILIKNGRVLDVKISIMEMPAWTRLQVQGESLTDHFVYEGSGYLHLAYKGCSFDSSQMCRFCSTFRRDSSSDHTAEETGSMVSAVADEIPDDVQFCLGGGTYLPFSENVDFFITIISNIRKRGKKNPVWVECIPPEIQDIERMTEAGATSFGFNIEIWDDKVREKICPGKSKIPRNHYVEACKYVINRCGKNKAGSCLIVGLDTRKNIVTGIDALTQIGAEPCILPYKKFNRGDYLVSEYNSYDFYYLSKYAARLSLERNVIFQENQGCLKCPCCTIMHDIQAAMIEDELGMPE